MRQCCNHVAYARACVSLGLHTHILRTSPELDKAIKRFENTQHQISNTLIEIDGDSAKVETYVTAHHYLVGDPDMEMTYLGRYLDRMGKRDGVWKIDFRKIVMTWHQNAPGSKDEERNPSLAEISRASRYPDDPWFGFGA